MKTTTAFSLSIQHQEILNQWFEQAKENGGLPKSRIVEILIEKISEKKLIRNGFKWEFVD